VLNWLIWTTFLAEMVVTTFFADRRGEWLRRHPFELVVIVFTVPLLPALFQGTRLFRLVRLLRLMRLVRFMQALRRLFTFEGLRYAAFLALMTALGGGAAFAEVENRSTWDGVYWAITTMTTVGYGDIKPVTTGGKVIAIFVMVVGIGFLTMVIGAVSQRFVSPSSMRRRSDATPNVTPRIRRYELASKFTFSSPDPRGWGRYTAIRRSCPLTT
jgi:voltage-gated potassium channel